MFKWLFKKKDKIKQEDSASPQTLYDAPTGESVQIEALEGNLD